MPLHNTTASQSKLHGQDVCVPNIQPVRPSFDAILDRTMQQVEYHCFADLRTGYIDPFFKELCLIISEVFFMNPDAVIKVNGSETIVSLVQEIYSRLYNDHLRLVFANFQHVSCRVYNKKAYLRTSLYNAVFEIELHFVNTDYADLPTD